MNSLTGCWRHTTFTDVKLTYVKVSVMRVSVNWLVYSRRGCEGIIMTAAQSDEEAVEVNPRAERSRAAVIEAMTRALDAHELGSVLSVAEISRAAGVSRPTWYQHFGDLPNLMRAAAMVRLVALFDSVPEPDSGVSW